MLSSILSLPVDVSQKLDEYSISLSTNLSPLLREHAEWTEKNFSDANRATSLLQAQWLANSASKFNAKRVLDIGCYTGLSALAFYEATKGSQAQIFTLEYDPSLAAAARASFQKYGSDDRIQVIEGRAEDALAGFQDPFDVVFIDSEFSSYLPLLTLLLDRKLLSERGIIWVDNVFARGFAVDDNNLANIELEKINHWVESGKIVRDFNQRAASDPRIKVTILPVFDGVSEIQWKL